MWFLDEFPCCLLASEQLIEQASGVGLGLTPIAKWDFFGSENSDYLRV